MSLAPSDPRHGTANGYANQDCRCGDCCRAHTAYTREHGLGTYARDRCECGGSKLVKSKALPECAAGRSAPRRTAANPATATGAAAVRNAGGLQRRPAQSADGGSGSIKTPTTLRKGETTQMAETANIKTEFCRSVDDAIHDADHIRALLALIADEREPGELVPGELTTTLASVGYGIMCELRALTYTLAAAGGLRPEVAIDRRAEFAERMNAGRGRS